MRMWCARRWLGLLGFVVAVGGVLGGIAPAQQGLIPEELVVGMVPSRAATILQPPVEGLAKLVLDYVQKNGFSQVKRVRAVIPESYPATIEAIGAEKIHVGLLGPFQIVQVIDSYGAIPINVTKRGEKLTFRSQFMVHVDSTLKALKDDNQDPKGRLGRLSEVWGDRAVQLRRQLHVHVGISLPVQDPQRPRDPPRRL
jgi:ABC-type phosphate/phosphonate transport system substrate-binding protein